MPLPLDVKHGTGETLRHRIGRWFRHPASPAAAERTRAPQDAVALSRTYWAASGVTEARAAALVEAHDRDRPASGRPRGNPAFAETLFVELMRARQYRRAFEQLSADCRARWGSAEAFAAAQGSAGLRRLQGVRVKGVRFLPEWCDADAGRTYQEVAELDVEYTLGDSAGSRIVPRVVHLVPDAGRWRSVCHPG